MTKHQPKVHTQFGQAAVKIFAADDRMNQVLIENLNPAACRAKPPGNTRTIVAIFTHMHNVRSKWVRLTAPHLKVPSLLNRAHCPPPEARLGLAESAARCTEMLAEALSGPGGRIEKFRRDGWAPPWPVGPEMLCYMLPRPSAALPRPQIGSPRRVIEWDCLAPRESGGCSLSRSPGRRTDCAIGAVLCLCFL